MLNLNKLIEKAEQLVYDGNIVNAAKGSIKVEDIEIGDRIYELTISLTIKSNDIT